MVIKLLHRLIVVEMQINRLRSNRKKYMIHPRAVHLCSWRPLLTRTGVTDTAGLLEDVSYTSSFEQILTLVFLEVSISCWSFVPMFILLFSIHPQAISSFVAMLLRFWPVCSAQFPEFSDVIVQIVQSIVHPFFLVFYLSISSFFIYRQLIIKQL